MAEKEEALSSSTPSSKSLMKGQMNTVGTSGGGSGSGSSINIDNTRAGGGGGGGSSGGDGRNRASLSSSKGGGGGAAAAEQKGPPTYSKKKKTTRKRHSNIIDRSTAAFSTLYEVNADAVPLVASPNAQPGTVLNDWVAAKNRQIAAWRAAGEGGADESPSSIGLIALLQFSTVKERVLMIVGLFCAAVSGLSMPIWLLLLAQSLETFNNIGTLVNSVGGEAAMELLQDQLLSLVWSFVVVGLLSLVFGAAYVAVWTYTGEKQALRIREKFVRSAFRQDLAWFDGLGDRQELPVMVANSLGRISDGIGRKIADSFANLLSSICCLAVALGLNASLALIMVTFLPFIAIAIAVISVFTRRRSGQALAEFASAGAFATEVITGIKTVASLCAEQWAVDRYGRHARTAQFYSIRSGVLSKLTAGVMGMLFYVAYTIAFLFGTEQAANTEEVKESKRNPFYCMINYCGISGSEVMVTIYGVILCAQFFALMSPGIQAVNLARQAAVDVFGAIRREPVIDASSDESGVKLDDGSYSGDIELRDLTFSYPTRPGDLIFQRLNLRVPAGSSVALVGPSGSGKSTISKLLLRFYDPMGGAVLAGGIPLTDLNLKWWRSRIGYVPQEPSLFPGTIRYNIAMGWHGDEPPTETQVIAAAKAASAHQFIMDLPDQYDTFYSGASVQLSGGQMQRIAIARSLIRDPVILILDEATSALDSQSEQQVQNALADIRKHRKITTVTVAHRLSTIVHSDQIAVLADGWVQELGTHAELIRLTGGIYAGLCESQGITAESDDVVVDSGNTSSSVVLSTVRESISSHNGHEITAEFDDIEAGRKSSTAAPVIDADNGKIEEGYASQGEDDEEEEEEEEEAPLARLWEYNRKDWAYMVLGTIGALIVGALPPTEGILFAKLTSNLFTLNSDEMRESNRRISLLFLALAAGSLLGNLAMGSGFSVSGYRLTRRMRTLVFERIMRHSMGWFDFPEHSAGELTLRLEEDAEAVSKVTGWSLGQQIQVIASLTAGLAISLAFSWRIGLIAIGCVPIIMAAALIEAKCSKTEVVHNEGDISSATILERGLHEINLVQAYNRQEDVSDMYCDALQPDARSKVEQGVRSGLVFGFSQFAVFCTFAVLFYAGLMLMMRQLVTFESFFIALLAVMFAAFGIGQVNADFNARHKGLAAAARLFALVDEPLDNDDPLSPDGIKPGSLQGTVQFESCTFSYPTRPNNPIYYPSDGRDGFNLVIGSKESVAFVGKSGCGKSTALQLLLRYYNVSSGRVILDSSNVQSLNMSWLRGNIGYVGQQPVLFAGSIRDNLLLGKPNASEEEMIKATKSANAHDFISKLHDGYDTDIGAGGSLLSGGQKQRVAIARAIISNPEILVLDEATSALDNESERIVQAALDEMQRAQPRTTLVVAHRLMTIKDCDKIAVLDRGGVKELGSHSSLLEQKGLYYDLWLKQGTDDSQGKTKND